MHDTPSHGPAGNARHPRCICGARGVRDEKHDAHFCPASGAWVEHVCDSACSFCKDRPPTAEYERTRERYDDTEGDE